MKLLASLTATALAFSSLFAAGQDGKTHRDYRREAESAYQRKDYAAALTATTEALKLRPDSPRYLYNLAALSALVDDTAAALRYLRQLAALGIVMPVQRDPDFAQLQGTREFNQVLELIA